MSLLWFPLMNKSLMSHVIDSLQELPSLSFRFSGLIDYSFTKWMVTRYVILVSLMESFKESNTWNFCELATFATVTSFRAEHKVPDSVDIN